MSLIWRDKRYVKLCTNIESDELTTVTRFNKKLKSSE